MMDKGTLLIFCGIIFLGIIVIYGVYWLALAVWWVWYTTLSWVTGLFGQDISGEQALALLFFWIIFWPGLRILRGSTLINYKKVENKA